jgi:hypothetical protein
MDSVNKITQLTKKKLNERQAGKRKGQGEG